MRGTSSRCRWFCVDALWSSGCHFGRLTGEGVPPRVASALARILPQFGGTGVSLLYLGKSGVPYSYVYRGDVNGDDFPGPRTASLPNDLIYVNDQASGFPGSQANTILWQSLYPHGTKE